MDLDRRNVAAGGVGEPTRIISPIHVLAFVGAVCFAVAVYVLARWVTSAAFAPSPVGSDPAPREMLIAVRSFEIIAVFGFFASFVWAYLDSKKKGRISAEGLILLGWSAVWWQDPLVNFARTTFFYNAYFVNFGSWAEFIPGFVNPAGHLYAFPLLLMVGTQGYVALSVIMLTALAMKKVRQRWSGVTPASLFLIGMLCAFLADFGLEVLWVRLGMIAWGNVSSSWSLWAGTPLQFPLYEALLWCPVWAFCSLIYFYRDSDGFTIIDRASNGLVPARHQWKLRVLAMIGLVNILYGTYNVAIVITTFHGDATPAGIPSYLRAGMCGPGTEYACPEPNLAVPLPRAQSD